LFLLSQKTYSSPLVAGGGLLAVAFFMLHLVGARRRGDTVPDAVHVLVVFALATVAVFAVVMGYSWGQLDDYEASRLALPVLLMGILFAVHVVLVMARPRWVFTVALVVTLAYIWVFTVPATARQYPSRRDNEMPRINWCMTRYQALPAGRYLVISPDRLLWAIHRISALQPWMANLRAEQIAVHRRLATFAEVLVFQKIRVDPLTGEHKTLRDSRLAPAFVLEPMAEMSFSPFIICRLSRVTEIDPERGYELTPVDGPQLGPGVDMEPIAYDHLEDYVRQLP
jgi:hypothetical protein